MQRHAAVRADEHESQLRGGARLPPRRNGQVHLPGGDPEARQPPGGELQEPDGQGHGADEVRRLRGLLVVKNKI